jgi:hypothetical protein
MKARYENLQNRNKPVSKASRPEMPKPVDPRTQRFRLMQKARAGNLSGQIEEQTQLINERTDELFQEAANASGKTMRNAGKLYYPQNADKQSRMIAGARGRRY